ncbi:MAG: alpha/beta hydrolase [Planctomycetaceae bacterium]
MCRQEADPSDMSSTRRHPPRPRTVAPLPRGAVLACAWLLWAAARAADPCPEPDVWVASTRRQPGICRMPARAALDVERLSGGDCGRWEPARIEDLLAAPRRPLVVFIHGNRYAAAEARSQGLRLARLIAAACPDAGPVRTLVFSWPSQQQGLLLRDVRAKYDRAHADGHYLAALLARVEPTVPVAVVGYSYGALVGLVALDDLASADRAGAAAWAGRPGRTHLVFVVPAVRCDALAPRGPHRGALAGVDRLTLVANSADHALQFFECVDRSARVEALGTAAMPRRWVPAEVEYSATDAAGVVGSGHPLPLYLAAPGIARRIAAGAVAGLDQPRGE